MTTEKYAVCAGSNYPGSDYELSGCVNDAQDWRALLEAEGYAVTYLEEPTLAELTGAVSAVVEAANGPGDRVVLTYSGHGTWMPDQDGDEADGRDEALVMGNLELLTDDAMQRLFEPLDGKAGGLILADTCHSGTMSRLFGNAPPVVDGARARFLPPTVFARNLSEQRAVELEQRAPSAPRRTVNLISGAADHEYAYDAWFNGRANGAFTRAAVDTYEPGVSLAAWYRRIRAELPNDRYPQTPQLTAQSTYRRYADAL